MYAICLPKFLAGESPNPTGMVGASQVLFEFSLIFTTADFEPQVLGQREL